MVAPEDKTEVMHMTDDQTPHPEEQHSASGRWGRMLSLGLLAVVLIFATILGIQLFGIIYALIFPLDAPLPEDVIEISHENRAYGSDRWVYGTSMDGCEVVEFYIVNGGTCIVAPGICGEAGFETSGVGQQNIGTCQGEDDFSIFSLRWKAVIASGYSVEPVTRFNLEQDVLWFGSTPAEDTPE